MCVTEQPLNKNSTEIHSIPLGLVLGGISLITVVMNILVLYAVKIEKKLHTVGNLYIVSLSCADLIVGAAVMPLNIVYLLKSELILDRHVCLFWLSMDYVASTASIFSLFVLCIDRYRSIQQPLKYLRYRTKTRASIMISASWLLSFLWVIPILNWRNFTSDNSTTVGVWNNGTKLCETDFSDIIWFKILTALVNFYLPSLMMLWFYAKIYKVVRRHYQHRKLINGSCISASEKSIVVNGKPHEMQMISSRDRNKGIEYSCNDNVIEDVHHSSGCVKISTISHREDGGDTMKPTCFPSTSGENDRKANNTDKKYAHVKKDIQNAKKKPCPQLYDLREVSDEHIFTKRLPSRTDYNLALEQSSYTEGCFPQYRSSKNSRSLIYLKKTWGRMRAYSMNYSQGLHMNRDRKAAKQLGCIMAAFMLCWSPYFVLFMVMAYCKSYQNSPFHMFTIWLGYVNSTLNPFIYPLCNENFKKTFKKIFHIKN